MRLLASLCLCLVVSLPARAQDVPGQFDYYVLALSWSPSWCRDSGDDRGDGQCQKGRGTDFVVHGLWPQYEQGWPENCRSTQRNPSRRESAEMADLMGSGGLAWYQWKKHGRCSGLPAPKYFGLLRRAAAAIRIPEVFDDLDRDIRLPARVIEDAFIEANPELTRHAITVTCRDDALKEVRICLTRDLRPRSCAPDARRDCGRPDILMEQVR